MNQKTILFVMVLSLMLHCSVSFANQAPAQDSSWYNWFKSTFSPQSNRFSDQPYVEAVEVRSKDEPSAEAVEVRSKDEPSAEASKVTTRRRPVTFQPERLQELKDQRLKSQHKALFSSVLDEIDPKISKEEVWYALGYDYDTLPDLISRKYALSRVKKLIKEWLYDNIEYPTKLTKINALLKRTDLLLTNVGFTDENTTLYSEIYNNVIFIESCNQLVQELQVSRKNATPEKRQKEMLIDKAIAQLNQQLSSSKNKYKSARDLMSPECRALAHIALAQECKECNQEAYGKERYEGIVGELSRRKPMTKAEKESFQKRIKDFSEKFKPRL